MGLQIISFGFALWLGLFLIARDFTAKSLRYTGLGLLTYGLALTFDLLARIPFNPPSNLLFLRLHWGMLFLPALYWAGALIHTLPPTNNHKLILERIWKWLLLPLVFLIAGFITFSKLLWNVTTHHPTSLGYLLFGMTNVLPLFTGMLVIPNQIRLFKSSPRQPRRATHLILLATLFFALGSGIITLQLDWIPHFWAVFAIGIDLEVLGFAIAYLDAFDQGETLLPDFLRSFTSSALVALLFGGQIAFAIAISTGPTLPMMILLLVSLTAAIFLQVYADPIQTLLDQLLFAHRPHLRQERAAFRGVAAALTRTVPTPSPLALEEAEFARLTRRALSHYGDLPKLASSPLTYLPLIETRLRQRGTDPNTLTRAAELKILLAESIERLKPLNHEPFGTSDQWRFYNALYYPYILGLRPYSRRLPSGQLDEPTRQALHWFRTQIPERTLHNWQTTAAELVAKDLRELSALN